MQRALPYIAFVLSGASSLIFQGIWTRMLHHVFGATSVAISSVLSVFMAGLGLGAWLAGRYADRIKHPIITYALAELAVGAWALVVPLLVDSEGWLATMNATLRESFGASSGMFMVARFLCVVPILIIPTTLMGASLPLLARHFVTQGESPSVVSARVGQLYAVNTAGAVIGVLLGGFVYMPLEGVTFANVIAAWKNFALGAMLLAARRELLAGSWKPGQKLSFLPQREPIPAAAPAPAPTPAPAPAAPPASDDKVQLDAGLKDTKSPSESAQDDAQPRPGGGGKKKKKKKVEGAKAHHEARAPERPPPERDGPAVEEDDAAVPIPPIARKAAFVAFAASGASALCYEVVWSRALAMTIGSSVYSFTLILATFLVGIAGGSAVAAGLMGKTRKPLPVIAISAGILCLLANVPWAVEKDVGIWLLLSALFLAPIVVIWVVVAARSRALGVPEFEMDRTIPGLLMLLLPAMAALLNALNFEGQLPGIVSSVVCAVCLFFGVLLSLRRYPVLLLAVIQLFIAAATFVSYIWQDEIPYAFAKLVTTISPDDLPNNVGMVMFFMFLTASLCTLPATLGMGAMFPLTIRVWTAGGKDVGREVGVVYAGNTVGSIIGAWLPGFVLLPMIGMERTLHVGIALNLALALLMLIVTAADAPKKEPAQPKPAEADGEEEKEAEEPAVPVWHSVTVYVLAPLIPALGALLYFGTAKPSSPLRWNLAHMTLGVFRVSLAADVLDPESWGEPDLVYYNDGLSTTVSVEKWGRHYALKNNGKVDASNGDDMPTQIMVAAYPLLMHPRTHEGNLDVAIIGFGSGVSVGTSLQFPTRSVDVIELERSIPEASKFFEEVNHLEYPLSEFPYVRMPRLTVINDDGRNFLASTSKRYDLIVSEPSNPWITGVSDLFTTDHWRITKQRLREGGIYCQWVQLYELSPENIKTIYRTFASQFRHVMVFAAEDLSSDTVLLGSDSPLPLDLERIQRNFSLPNVPAEMERAYVHSPFDVFARLLFASKSEVLQYTQFEERLRGGEWEIDYGSSNGNECPPRECRREPVELNTDDNALIEFAAPRDLIGFQRYEGYLANIYSPDWPYGRLTGQVRGMGRGEDAARNYAELAMALIAHGRKAEAAEFIRISQENGRVRETLVALEVLTMLMSDEDEPRITIEPPVPGPQMDERTARRLEEGFEKVRAAVDDQAWQTALTEMEDIPAPLRLHSGPSMRFLYGYLLYKAADGNPGRYRSAIDELEDVIRSDEAYVQAHPEVYYFLARAHDAEFNFDKALRNMRTYVEARVVTSDGEEVPEPPAGEAPTTDEPGESAKDIHRERS